MTILFATAADSPAWVLLLLLIGLGKIAPLLIPLAARYEAQRRRQTYPRGTDLYAARRRALQPSLKPDAFAHQRMAAPATAAWVARRAEREKALVARRVRRDATKKALKAQRDAFYRARGVEPGPWAWFRVLPDLAQAVLLGLSLSVPAVAITFSFFQIVLPLAGS